MFLSPASLREATGCKFQWRFGGNGVDGIAFSISGYLEDVR